MNKVAKWFMTAMVALGLLSPTYAVSVCPGNGLTCSSEPVCQRPASQGEILLCEDWEAQSTPTGATLPGWNWASGWDNCTTITSAGGALGSANALKFRIPESTGTGNGGECGYPGATGVNTSNGNNPNQPNIGPLFLRFYVKFSSNYRFMCTNAQKIAYMRASPDWRTMLGLQAWDNDNAAEIANTCDDNTIGRFIIDSGQHVQLWSDEDTPDNTDANPATPQVQRDTWYCMEMEVQSNTGGFSFGHCVGGSDPGGQCLPFSGYCSGGTCTGYNLGNSDGHFKVWKDDKLLMSEDGVTLLATDHNLTEVPYLSQFYGGSTPPTHPEQYVTYDNIVVSRGRIHCASTAPPTLKTVYVRTDGNDTRCTGLVDAVDTGAGSAQPCAFASPVKCTQGVLNPGDTCEIGDGTYSITPTSNTIPAMNVCNGPSGDSALRPTTYKAKVGAAPKFCAEGTCAAIGAGNGAVFGAAAGFTGAPTGPCNNILIDGIRVDGGFLIKGEDWAGVCQGGSQVVRFTGDTSTGASNIVTACSGPNAQQGNKHDISFTTNGTATAVMCGVPIFDTLLALRDDGGGSNLMCNDDTSGLCAGAKGSKLTWTVSGASVATPKAYDIHALGYDANGTYNLDVTGPGTTTACAHDGQCSATPCVGSFTKVHDIRVTGSYFEGGFDCNAAGDYSPAKVQNATAITLDHNTFTGLTTTGCFNLTAPNPSLLKLSHVYNSLIANNSISRGGGAASASIDAKDSILNTTFKFNILDQSMRLSPLHTAGFDVGNVVQGNLFTAGAGLAVPARSDALTITNNLFTGALSIANQAAAIPVDGSPRYYGTAQLSAFNNIFVGTPFVIGDDSWGTATAGTWSLNRNAYSTAGVWAGGGGLVSSTIANWRVMLTTGGISTSARRDPNSIEADCTFVDTVSYRLASGACTTLSSSGGPVGPWALTTCIGPTCTPGIGTSGIKLKGVRFARLPN